MAGDKSSGLENPSRRGFLKTVGAILGLGTATVVAGNKVIKIAEGLSKGEETNVVKPPEAVNTSEEIPRPEPLSAMDEMYRKCKIAKNEIIERAVGFMNLEPHSDERFQSEAVLCQMIEEKGDIGDILYAVQALAHPTSRSWMMELFWNKAQQGQLTEFGIEKMDDEKIKWAVEQGVDPRTLMIAEYTLSIAKELFRANIDTFLEAEPPEERELNFDLRFPNPGVVAKLMMTETGGGMGRSVNYTLDDGTVIQLNSFGFANIGSVFAWTQANIASEWFPSAHSDLDLIAKKIRGETGLPFEESETVHTIPGSAWVSNDYVQNGSGGAIGPQFMPINMILHMWWYEKANRELNGKYPIASPFDPFTATIMVYHYLAGEYYRRYTNPNTASKVVKPGYMAGNPLQMQESLEAWNPFQAQVSEAITVGEMYYNKYGRGN